MKPLPRLLLTSLLFAAAGSAMAASSVDLTVTGLITPSACTPTLASGGTVDFGKISAKDLNADPAQPTLLEKRTQAITITCDAATLVALQGQDNRAGTDWGGTGNQYGLGMVNGTEKLGDFGLSWSSLTADGVAVRSIASYNNGSTWQTSTTLRPGALASVADNTTVAPMPLTVLSGDIELETYIAPTNELTLGSELTMDGSVTLQVVYL
ncbi:DUF1120 domain-containing protein [Pseudomonas costantinii]|uniref:Pilin (Type 1 fimbria component protein) n=1 Tax=Pseudomonas costantinii TaxID=168469 RepID=A0A1S2UTR9_9PSED|nr:DUF1120 domain-containing protein [Pseudomonas costantinii]NVZ22927.1 DUF1120 domain-containing protein [Pseudomonas costantinii]OIN49630.1 hypothetical protein BFL40_23075 [Pseudomonas costantinii]SEE22278.1 Pilin (type 1 fimbria component protein) [Pseudomonas costantinii]